MDHLRNEMGRVHGPVVQARDIHGGVHLHGPAARPIGQLPPAAAR